MENKNIIVAVVGMCGAGKSVATEEFKKAGFEHTYFGNVTFNEMKKRGLEINEQNERLVREELRKSGDLSIYAKLIEPEIREKLEKGNVVVESLYAWSEYKYLKEIYKERMKLLAIITDRQVRIDRLKNRTIRPLTAEETISRDYAQIEKLEQGGPIAHADHFILNNGSMEELQAKLKEYIKSLID
jgi:dephospho-CoA kinase